ncbi:MAG: hypothetical protein KatS3mg115_1904 [Candidatus Poribacteria bacterium]|nr:MAG: hypothetical protein KatS3mg115_1904 [Candidatus Poribacteria bacterium]
MPVGTPRFARSIGGLYSLNTLGAIFGSLAAAFVIIPAVGIRNGVLLTALVNLATALLVLRSDPRLGATERWTGPSLGLLVLLLAFFLFPKTQFFVKSAIYQEQFVRFGDRPEVLFYAENADATVTVLRDGDGVKRLYCGHERGGKRLPLGRPFSPSNRPRAAPAAPQPPNGALVVGFGMGRTSRTITRYGVVVDAVEISPGVVEAARRFFSDANEGVLDSPLLRLHINDGRNFILTTSHRYDMISTGIIHPLVSSGSSAIYSKDFYELCRAILSENGVMSQWVPLHRLPLPYLKTIVRTFLEVFPHTTVWYKYTPDFLILIGTKHPQQIDIQDWMRRTTDPTIDAELAKDDLDTWSLLDSFLMGEEAARRFAAEAPLHTDDRPILEFFRGELGGITTTQVENIRALKEFREPVFSRLSNFASAQQRQEVRQRLERYFEATQHLIEGQIAFAALQYDSALQHFRLAARTNPEDPTIGYHQAETTRIVLEEQASAFSALIDELRTQLQANPDDVQTLINLGLGLPERRPSGQRHCCL